jgi:hypothetical protein
VAEWAPRGGVPASALGAGVPAAAGRPRGRAWRGQGAECLQAGHAGGVHTAAGGVPLPRAEGGVLSRAECRGSARRREGAECLQAGSAGGVTTAAGGVPPAGGGPRQRPERRGGGVPTSGACGRSASGGRSVSYGRSPAAAPGERGGGVPGSGVFASQGHALGTPRHSAPGRHSARSCRHSARRPRLQAPRPSPLQAPPRHSAPRETLRPQL